MQVVAQFMVIKNCLLNRLVDHPISLYANKKSNELIAHTYSHLFNLPTTGLRFSLFMGHGEDLIWLFINSQN